MAQLALGLAGAAIGSFFGPIGTSIGWALGATAGGLLFAKDQTVEQPRPTDLHVTVASYGAPLAIRLGTWKGGGVIIWHSPEFRAIRAESVSGGKGGPKVKTISYTYEIDVAVAVADHEIGGVSRIWLDGRPVLDQRDAATLATLIASQDWCEAVTVYTGSETQDPDPTIEAEEGAGAVPAYRGVAYLVIRGLKCGQSPRLPNLEFEVCTGITDPPTQVLVAELPSDQLDPIVANPYNNRARVVRVQGDLLYVNYADGVSAARFPIGDVESGTVSSLPHMDGEENWPPSAPLYNGDFHSGDPDQGLIKNTALVQYSPEGHALYFRGLFQKPGASEVYPSLRAGLQVGSQWIILGPETTSPDVEWITRVEHSSTQPIAAAGCADRNYFWMAYPDDKWAIWRIDGAGQYTKVRSGTIDTADYSIGLAYGIGPTTWDGATQESFYAAACLESDLTHYWVTGVQQSPDGTTVECWEIGADDVMRPLFLTYFNANNTQVAPKSCFADKGFCWAYSARGEDVNTDVLQVFTRLPLYTTGPIGLDDVVSIIYGLTGNSAAADLTVTSLASTEVRGFEITGPRPARQAIEILRTAFFFDAVESDARLKFVMRGGSVGATLEADDLAVCDETPGGAVPAERRHETEIPARVTVDYVSSDGDYRRGAQQAQRQTTGSEQVMAVQLPVVLSDDEAAAVADLLLREQWRARTTRRFATARTWAKLEPTDVVDVSDSLATYRLRIVADRRTGALTVFDAVDEGGSTYSSAATGAAVVPPAGVATSASAKLVVLDLPPLRDDDDGGYQYVAAVPYSGSTLRVEVFRGTGGEWEGLAPLTAPATIGAATQVLGNGRTDIVDEANTVQVQLIGAGTLASVTYAQLLEGAQYAAIGAPGRWEIIAFASVTDDGDSRYTLSRLLRGRRGTEDAIASHAVGDLFVLLSASTLARVPVAPADVGSTMQWAAVPAGRSVEATPTISVTNELRSLKPLAPVQLRATRQPETGDIVFTWVRRARIDADWRDFVDVPLDESEELYDLEIIRQSDGAVMRTITVSEPTATYTQAQRTADFASSAAEMDVRVYQRSARVGRGMPAELTDAGALTFSRNWDNGVFDGQTLASTGGVNAPSQFVSAGVFVLKNGYTSGNPGMACSRFDILPAFVDGQIEVDLPPDYFGTSRGVVFRTSYWTGLQGTLAYVVEMGIPGEDEVLRLRKGTNSATDSATTLGEADLLTLGIFESPYTLRVVFIGSSIKVYFNDQLVIDVVDSTHAAAGKVGLMGYNSSNTSEKYFDNLTITVY